MVIAKFIKKFFSVMGLGVFFLSKPALCLNIGDKAPEINLPNQKEEIFNISNYAGKKNIVVYFYPKDKTPGCSIESAGFSALVDDFGKLDTLVVGISQDDATCHNDFIADKKLTVTLLSDITGDVAKRYDSYKKGMLFNIQRNTFVINKEGIIKGIWRDVSVFKNPKEVFEFIKNNKI